jgi:hypothetical protein
VRKLDTPDDPRRLKVDAASAPRESAGTTIKVLSERAQGADPLAAFATEPPQRRLKEDAASAPRESGGTAITELSEQMRQADPLAVFATEPTQRLFIEPAQPKRFERPERRKRLKRFKRPRQLMPLALGGLALAGVAVVTVMALGSLSNRQASQPPVTAQARAEPHVTSAPLVTERTEPAAPAARVSRVNERAQQAPVLSKTGRVDAPERRTGSIARAALAPTDVVERPSRESVLPDPPPRAADRASLPAPGLTAPTTGVSPAESTTRSSAATPIVAAVAPAPPPVAAANAPPPIAPPPAAAPRVVAPRTAVESVLDRYASAFSALDAGGAKAVWPSVNQRSLEKAFDTLVQQEFDLGTCDIMVLPPRALAQCDGSARYTPKVGDKRERTVARHWTFRLQQNGQDWSIEKVDSR